MRNDIFCICGDSCDDIDHKCKCSDEMDTYISVRFPRTDYKFVLNKIKSYVDNIEKSKINTKNVEKSNKYT